MVTTVADVPVLMMEVRNEIQVVSQFETLPKYILAWMLGVPGGLILLWFLFNHAH